MNDEIRQIITDQINRHVAMTGTHRAWLAKDISDRVCVVVDGEFARLLRIEKLEYNNRGILQEHTNRCELPWETRCPHEQTEAVQIIVDEFNKVQAALARFADAEADRVGPSVEDKARVDWIEHMAAECEGHILTRLFLPDGKPFREKIDAAMQLNPA